MIAWPLPQITNSVPFGWYANDGMPAVQEHGTVFKNSTWGTGVLFWDVNEWV